MRCGNISEVNSEAPGAGGENHRRSGREHLYNEEKGNLSHPVTNGACVCVFDSSRSLSDLLCDNCNAGWS